jgi:hypothetical protein
VLAIVVFRGLSILYIENDLAAAFGNDDCTCKGAWGWIQIRRNLQKVFV